MSDTNQQYRNLLAQAVNEPVMEPAEEDSSLPDLDGYEIESMLGQGGMGTVYRAKDLALDRWVAIKVFSSSSLDPMSVERFKQESQIMARLSHPNVVSIYGVTSNNPVCLILEYLEGGDLGRYIQECGSLSIEQTRKLGIDICEGIAAIHDQSVIHRDLKPANILLSKDGIAKVADLGIARDKASATMTMTGTYVGSLAYTAPEQMLENRSAVDHRADIWSMGVLLYEMLTGSLPQMDIGSDSLESVPVKMRDILKRCLRSNPAERYVRILDLKDDLVSLQSPNKPPFYKSKTFLISTIALGCVGIGVSIPFSKPSMKTIESSEGAVTVPEPIMVKPGNTTVPSANSLDLISALKSPLVSDVGNWALTDGELRCSRINGPSVISLPVSSKGTNYDLEFELSRVDGSSGAAVFLTTSIGNVTLDLDGWNRGLSGIQNLNGDNLKHHHQTFQFSMTNDRFYRVKIEVRRDDISVSIDGKKVYACTLSGNRGSILNLWQVPRKGNISLGSYNSAMAFRKVIYTPKSY